jgi:hypothetical protein
MIGQDRTGYEVNYRKRWNRTGQSRAEQSRTGQNRTGQDSWNYMKDIRKGQDHRE